MAGAEVMVLPSMYPVAPATMHPTASPTMMLAFFKNGEPNNSVMIMLTNERKPRPMNCGEPHLRDDVSIVSKRFGSPYGSACLDVMVGHRESGPLVGRA